VKFKWRPTTKRPEWVLSRLAEERKVWGVASIEYDRIITSTARLRQGLPFGRCRKLPASHRSAEESDIGGVAQHTEESSHMFMNRTFICVVISPAGRSLTTFKDRLELLQVLRDAVKAHRSLFQDGIILHRYMSVGNIIIVEPRREGDPRGMLIDFDVVVDLAFAPNPNIVNVAGDRPFMAIGILKQRSPHRYRYDLESLLYTFLHTILCDSDENLPPTSRLRQWNQGTWDESAEIKTHDMHPDHFTNLVLIEFTP
jgi:hypothetical protein